jgi:hypothetical protein
MIGIMWLRDRSREPRPLCCAIEKNVMNGASKGSAESPANMPCATRFSYDLARSKAAASHARAAVPPLPLTFL